MLTHLLILAGYCGVIFLTTHREREGQFERAILSVLPIGLHVVILLAQAIDKKSKTHLLSAILVLLIGWSFCTSAFTL